MKFKKQYIEKRIVCATKKNVWKLLTDCSYLGRWVPQVALVELVSGNLIENNSLLWIDITGTSLQQTKICRVDGIEYEKRIFFHHQKKGLNVVNQFVLSDEIGGCCTILMTIEFYGSPWKSILKSKAINEIILDSCAQLDALDQATTKYRHELRSL